MAAGEHGDGAGRKRAAMARGVNAARQPRNDDETGRPQIAREARRERAPAAEALRDPTIATAGSVSAAALPRTARSGGASAVSRRRAGYSASPSPMKRAPSFAAAAISVSASAREGTASAPPP
jgi:hypothetical protein